MLDYKVQMSKPLASVERMFENQLAWRVEPGSHSWQIFCEAFEAHVFVDAGAEAGESSTLTLRVEPQVAGIAAQEMTLSAVVAP